MDTGLLLKAALLAETRGPHAFGMAWRGTAAIEILRIPDRFSNHTDKLTQAADTPLLLGLCRLSTSGTPIDNRNNQPVQINYNFLVHNGNVHLYEQIYQQYDYTPHTDCDSEALLLLAMRTNVHDAVGIVGQYSRLAAAFLFPDTLVLVAHGHPLYLLKTDHGTYFCSRQMSPHVTLRRGSREFST